VYIAGPSCEHRSTRKDTWSRGSGGPWGVSQGLWFTCTGCCEVVVGGKGEKRGDIHRSEGGPFTDNFAIGRWSCRNITPSIISSFAFRCSSVGIPITMNYTKFTALQTDIYQLPQSNSVCPSTQCKSATPPRYCFHRHLGAWN